MRKILCVACGQSHVAGTRMTFASDDDGPAEYERVTWGKAKTPTREQMTIRVEEIIGAGSVGKVLETTLPTVGYRCDMCNALIPPGTMCCAWTVWSHRGRPSEWLDARIGGQVWEREYLEEAIR